MRDGPRRGEPHYRCVGVLRFEDPTWLWWILAALPLGLAGWAWFAAMSRARKGVAVLLRLGLIAALAGALAGLSRVTRTENLAVVAVVDASESVRRLWREAGTGGDPLERAWEFVGRATANRGADDLLGLVVFDGRAMVLRTPTRAPAVTGGIDARGTDGSDLAGAIRLARSIIPPDAGGRIVLISDGNQTSGDALAAARETAGLARAGAMRRGIPIDVAPLRYHVEDEVMVESVDAPPAAPEASTIALRVLLEATSASTGTLRVLREGRPVRIGGGAEGLGRRVALVPGANVQVVEVRLDASRVHRFRVVYEPDALGEGLGLSGDTFADNNSGDAVTITPGRGSVLVIDGTGEAEPSPLARALRDAGVEVGVVAPEQAPPDLLSLQAYDLVVLENVAAEALSEEFQEWLGAFVRDMGGGLVMAGGPDSFGAGGWRGTELEKLLPVRLEIPDRAVAPDVATIFVIDNSGSMSWSAMGSGRSKQELADEATALAISRLRKADLVGIIAFNTEPEVVVPLGANADIAGNQKAAREIYPGGGTNIPPAVEEALDQLARVDVKQKHVIVLSDGLSMGRERLAGLAERARDEGVKLSTVAVGLDADGQVMERMATIAGGRYYHVLNPNALPRIFLKAVRVVRSPLVRDEAFQPVVLAPESPLAAGVGVPPMLNGLNLTAPREEPAITLAMASPRGDPLLAHWNVGLGKVVAFTSDARRWGQPWLGWEAYRRFWLQVVRQTARAATGRAFEGDAQVRDEVLHVTVRATDPAGSPLDGLAMPATVYTPTGVSRAFTLAQSGPGVYEGSLAAPERGTYVALVRPGSGGTRLAPVLLGATARGGAELRSLASNAALLEQIAEATGGRVLDVNAAAPASLFLREGVAPQEAVTNLWRGLLVAALALLMLDIAARRIAWDRWVGREFAQEARASLGVRGEGATGVVAGLRASRRRGADGALALDERDAEALATAARDRRRAVRLAQAQGEQGTSVDGGSEGGSSLLAAKRRAAERFEDQGDA